MDPLNRVLKVLQSEVEFAEGKLKSARAQGWTPADAIYASADGRVRGLRSAEGMILNVAAQIADERRAYGA